MNITLNEQLIKQIFIEGEKHNYHSQIFNTETHQLEKIKKSTCKFEKKKIRIISSPDRFDWIRRHIKESEKGYRYTHEYKKIMNYFKHSRMKERDIIHKNSIIDGRIKRLVRTLKQEEYTVRKYLAEEICNFRSIECFINFPLHEIIIDEIIFPVFVTEYKEENKKYIEWMQECCHELLFQDYVDIHDYGILSCWGIKEDHIELLQELTAKLERSKESYRIYDHPQWKKIIYNWELLITYFSQYDEYVKNNGYIEFKDYSEKIGPELWDKLAL